MPASPAYIPAGQPGSPDPPGPLGRYLPPIPPGVASAWLKQNLPAPAGAWVLDPFGAAPAVAAEVARAGYRVLVAANNPIARSLLDLIANPPTPDELRSALAEIAAAYKGSERLEPHLRGLYTTRCARCGAEVMAEAFIWERGAAAPSAKIYTCPACGDGAPRPDGPASPAERERPATEADARLAATFAAGGLHRARALERVAPLNDPDRRYAEEALEAYLPRALYALVTLINKLEQIEPGRQRVLQALYLAAFDRGSTLWPWPGGRTRPRQLGASPRFRENNLWLALEEAVQAWGEMGSRPLPLTTFPEPPPETGGICVFEGRLKDLAAGLEGLPVGAVLAALPRPNQAYWSLSALWAGWLWGHEAAAPFKSVLRRRRYDWAWHATALQAAFSSLASGEGSAARLPPGTRFLGLAGEAGPGFITAAVTAASLSPGFTLAGIALRGDQAQLTWILGSEAEKAPPLKPATARQGAREYLRQRGEPAPYLHLYSAALSALAPAIAGLQPGAARPSAVLSDVQAAVRHALEAGQVFERMGGEGPAESGRWWLADAHQPPPGDPLPLADRVEIAAVRFLLKQAGCPRQAFDAAMCAQFPALLTPEAGLISAILDSYCAPAPEAEQLSLREEDLPRRRRAELAQVQRTLLDTGRRLGYAVESGEQTVIWAQTEGSPAITFKIVASAVISPLLLDPSPPPGTRVLVYPGGRAGLILYKLRNDPRLEQAAAGQAGPRWQFLKFRHLRRLVEGNALGAQNLAEQLAVDPLDHTDPQLKLF